MKNSSATQTSTSALPLLPLLLTLSGLYATPSHADSAVQGTVTDLNGRPLSQAMVSVSTAGAGNGAIITTVFTDPGGRFVFPRRVSAARVLSARKPGYEQLAGGDGNIVMRQTPNYADTAPASAWLETIPHETRMHLVLNCVTCHQVPSPEVRHYAQLVDAQNAPDPLAARTQSWAAMARYMNLMWAEEVARGVEGSAPVDAAHGYSVGDVDGIAAILAEHFVGPMQELTEFDYGAPLAVTSKTTIREYEIARPNAVREALLLGDPARLWVADVSSDRIFAVDVESGRQQTLEVPAEVAVGPHTLHPGPDRSLWIGPFYNGVVAHLDVATERWRVWQLQTRKGTPAGIHDLSFGPDHQLLTDRQGRIWFSDIVNNAVGWFDPETGANETFDAPVVDGRPPDNAQLYGLAMTEDRNYVWYSQLGIGVIGCFNVETLKYETVVELPEADSGPRRLAIGDDGILYVPLYGSGQLLVYDTYARKQLGVYDLPQRGSAPYAVTWDPVRKVVWIPTSNADAIYRFDPATRQFGVIPLPRQRAFLRMIDVDPESGVLVTSYANIIEQVHGPRMALIVDPGDGAYDSVRSTR
jgi:streptogramin lyase